MGREKTSAGAAVDAQTASRQVEEFLRSERASNQAVGRLPSENAVIERLLNHSPLTQPIYCDLVRAAPWQWQMIIARIVTVSAFWNPDRTREMREAERHLQDLNTEIPRAAEEIANRIERISGMIQERERIGEKWSMIAHDTTGVRDILQGLKAARHTLAKLQVSPLGEPPPGVRPVDALTEAALASRKHSVADFVRALFADFEQLRDSALIPQVFHLSDRSLADIANTALPGEGLALTASDVKRIRHS
jgi:hypothetical protein